MQHLKTSVSLLLLLLWATVPLLAAESPLPKIPIVRTWGDLMSLPPLIDEEAKNWITREEDNTPGRVKIRLGFNEKNCAVNGGLVLYCLVESASQIDIPFNREDSFGPLWVEIERPALAVRQIATRDTAFLNSVNTAGPFRIYMKVIPLPKPGKYTVKVSAGTEISKDSKTRAIAIAEVDTGKEALPTWSPWEERHDEISSESSPHQSADALVSNSGGGDALPAIEGWEKQGVSEKIDPKQILPQLIPDFVEPGCTASPGKDQLLVTLSNKYDLSWPPEYFLTRWWINGKPVTLPDDFPQSQISTGGIMMMPKNQVLFDLKFVPERLGIKESDEIGLQLLFCPFRWKYSSDQAQSLMSAQKPDAPPKPLPFPNSCLVWIIYGKKAISSLIHRTRII